MPKDDKLDLMLDTVDLEIDRLDLAIDRETLRLLVQVGREIRRMEDKLVADLASINSALEELSTEITQLGEQVATLQAGTVTQEQLDQIAAGITAAGESVDAIITDDDVAAETPAEETPAEEAPPA